jgi:hypothetical protein
MPFTSKKMQKATMMKFSVTVTQSPHANTGPSFWASASGKCAPKVAEIEVADQLADGRHDDVLHQRIDDVAKRRTNDDADGEIHDVAAHGEGFEFLNYFHGWFPFAI